jgi:luciferase family oxidoreductase group 1
LNQAAKVPFSVLDLALVKQGGTIAHAFAETVELARHAEQCGYKRFWLAEHHNMAGVASAATSVLIGHVAENTSKIRVGSGGVMLPNHSPLVIAEQFGTLATLFPDRIDLGLGRAPGTDRPTLHALRRRPENADDFPEQVKELLALLEPAYNGQLLRAVPGSGTRVPVWILGSSTFGAQLAAHLGLPFAFAAHFAPRMLADALRLYRLQFNPSQWLGRPYAMLCVPVVAAGTDAEARHLSTSLLLKFQAIVRGDKDSLLPPPVEDAERHLASDEKIAVDSMTHELIVGSPSTIASGFRDLLRRTGADELMIACNVFDQQARLHSYELIAEVLGDLP